MDPNVQPRLFWQSVTNYSQNDMTNTQADYEQSQVFDCIDSNQDEEIKNLFCFGVADGLREPISILKHIEQQKRPLPSNVIINDIAKNLLDEAIANLTRGGWNDKINGNIIRILSEIHMISPETTNTTKLSLGIIGVYNIGYFANALKLYQKNAHIIGKQFNVYPVYLTSNESGLHLECGDTIRFDIMDLSDDIINQIHKNVDSTKELYAQCVYTTDNNFVSHYFNGEPLQKLLKYIFIGFNVEIRQEVNNGRYLIVKLEHSKPTGNGITLMTTLNNVLGNITTHAQMDSLRVLKRLID